MLEKEMAYTLIGNTATDEWTKQLKKLMQVREVYKDEEFKTKDDAVNTYEIINSGTTIDMSQCILNVPSRELGYKFMAKEALNIIVGFNQVGAIRKFSPTIENYSDDGYFFNGHYGPMLIDQYTYIVDKLIEHDNTRQAVATIWRPNPRDSKDIPCTVSVQFIIRGGRLHCIDTMRSSDIWLGWPYDIFNFTMVTAYISCLYGLRTGERLRLGNLFLNAGSQHLYLKDVANAEKCLEEIDKGVTGPEMQEIKIEDFEYPFEIIDWLNEKALSGDFSAS